MLGARKAVRPSFVLSGKRRGRILVVGQVGYPEWPAAWLLSSLICLFAKSYSKKGDGDNPRTCYGSLVREVAVSMAVYFIGERQFAPAIVLAGTLATWPTCNRPMEWPTKPPETAALPLG